MTFSERLKEHVILTDTLGEDGTLTERPTCVKTYRLKETITLILGEPVNTYKEGLAEDVSTEKLNVLTLTG